MGRENHRQPWRWRLDAPKPRLNAPGQERRGSSRLPALRLALLGFVLWMAAAVHLPAAETNRSTTGPGPAAIEAAAAARSKQAYLDARRRFQADTNHAEAAWQFARACFDLAAAATNRAERARLAEQGIAVSQRLTAVRPNLAAAHYYLGMNLGQLADTKRNLSALGIVREMEREFETARKLDERLDYAGPDRNLGLLYFQAPSFFSIGDRVKARQHLRRAIELTPEFPGNRLDLIDACIKWGSRTEALTELKTLEELWPEARKKFTGQERAADWLDWERRLQNAKRKLGQPSAAASSRR